jgi:hypothetical protein
LVPAGHRDLPDLQDRQDHREIRDRRDRQGNQGRRGNRALPQGNRLCPESLECLHPETRESERMPYSHSLLYRGLKHHMQERRDGLGRCTFRSLHLIR